MSFLKVYESLLKELNGYNVIVKPEDAHQYLQTWGFRQPDMTKILEKVQDIPSDKLDSERKSRLITFMKGTQHQASLDDIKAAFVSPFLNDFEIFNSCDFGFNVKNTSFNFSLQAYLYGSA